MARMPKISKKNLEMYNVVKDEHTRNYIKTIPKAMLEAAGLYMEASTGRWLYRAGKNLPRVLETLRQGTPPAVKAATPYKNTRVLDWDDESQSVKPDESMRTPNKGTVPKAKKIAEKKKRKEKLGKRPRSKQQRGM